MDMAPLILIRPFSSPSSWVLWGCTVQFGIMMMLNLGIGLCTPPVGSASSWAARGKISIESDKGDAPLLRCNDCCLLLVTFIPQLVLFIPNMLMGN